DGDPLSWDLEIPSSYADWVDVSQLLVEQYEEIGIELTPQGVSFESWVDSRNAGDFKVTMAAVAIGQTPFDMYKDMMSSEYEVDSGSVISNFGRFYSDDADAALKAFATTDDEQEQQQAVEDMQQVMVEEFPAVRIF